MGRDGIVGCLSVTGSLTSLDGESRQLRLPRMNPFPKLGRPVVRPSPTNCQGAPSRSRAAAILGGDCSPLPEVTSDVINVAANYPVENVKRDRRAVARSPWGTWVNRILNAHRAVRP